MWHELFGHALLVLFSLALIVASISMGFVLGIILKEVLVKYVKE